MSLRFHPDSVDLSNIVVGEAYQLGDAEPMISLDAPPGTAWFGAAGPEGVTQLAALAAKVLLAEQRLGAFITAAGGAA